MQAFCDLLEVRWLLSEEAGRDVGEEEALPALRLRFVPYESAAAAAVFEPATDELLRLRPDVVARSDRDGDVRTSSGEE